MLPPYYVIHNCILIACTLEDWDEANLWRRSAEQAYWTTYAEALRKNDLEALEQLKNVRMELDQLESFRIGDTKEAEGVDVDMAEQELLENVEGFDFEDAEAVADTENQDEVEADKTIDLAFCPASGAFNVDATNTIRDANPTSQAPTSYLVSPTEGLKASSTSRTLRH
jgi:hypothetical protein